MQKVFPGILSLLLPGLGQLYKKQNSRACLFFSAFLAFQLIPNTRMYLPIVLALAALEAFLTPTPPREVNRQKDVYYGAVALVGLLNWSLSYFPLVHSVGYQMELNDRVPHIVKEIRECQTKEKRLAVDLAACVSKANRIDPWGNPMRFTLVTEGGFEIRSAGPDKFIETSDDYVYRFR